MGFDEESHPRDGHGKFASGAGGGEGSGGAKKSRAEAAAKSAGRESAGTGGEAEKHYKAAEKHTTAANKLIATAKDARAKGEASADPATRSQHMAEYAAHMRRATDHLRKSDDERAKGERAGAAREGNALGSFVAKHVAPAKPSPAPKPAAPPAPKPEAPKVAPPALPPAVEKPRAPAWSPPAPAAAPKSGLSAFVEKHTEKPAEKPKAEPSARLEMGKHLAKGVQNPAGLSHTEVAAIMQPIASHAGTRDYLEKHPLESVRISSGLVFGGSAGMYEPGSKRLFVSMHSEPGVTHGVPWQPGHVLFVSQASETAHEGAQKIFSHELGHHLHTHDMFDDSPKFHQVNQIIEDTFHGASSSSFISHYARQNKEEFWSENFATYVHFKNDLKTHSPAAYKMVEDVLKIRGILK